MAQTRLFLLASGFLLLYVFVSADACAQDRQACAEVKQELHARRQKLAEYIGALQNFQKKSDWTLAEIFSKEITRMITDIRRLTETLNCPDGHQPSPRSGLSPVKADMGAYATKSCAELKQTLVQLLVITNAPKRRERAYASPLSREEKAELKRNMRELEKVRNALRARCSATTASGRKRR